MAEHAQSNLKTMIAGASRHSSAVAIFTTTDGVTFTSHILPDAASADGSTTVAFGQGNTLWLKSMNGPLRHIEFDLATEQSKLLLEWPDPVLSNWVSNVAVKRGETSVGGWRRRRPRRRVQSGHGQRPFGPRSFC